MHASQLFSCKLGLQVPGSNLTMPKQVTWVAGEADAVVRTRLKNASVIHGLHEEKVRPCGAGAPQHGLF